MGELIVPDLALVVLVGASGAGKSTFARRHFKPTEVLSSDFCRGLVADDENDQAASTPAFDVLHYIARTRLAAGRLTVIDATNVDEDSRRPLVALAREFHCLPVAIVFDLPERLCRERNAGRADRDFGMHVLRRQCGMLRRSLGRLGREGFRYVHVMRSPAEVEHATIVRQPLWNNRREECGPFDIIGDVHGCLSELCELLRRLGYSIEPIADPTPFDPPRETYRVRPPAGRKAVFLGDLVDRGPDTPGVLRLVMAMVRDGVALCVPGNHDVKLVRALRGRNVTVSHGLAESLAQLATQPEGFACDAADFLDGLVSHYVLDGGRLVVAHAGLIESMHGRGSGAVREFALYGETTGETDEFGLPVRCNWAADYRGRACVVYGHTPVPQPEWLNGTINIDTGCVFGGRLTALRWPERQLVSVAAERVHAEPVRPLAAVAASTFSAQHELDDVLDFADVSGRRLIETTLLGPVTIRGEHAASAIEAMSRFAVDPKWLIYLPPTMSPVRTSREPELLEHPADAFDYFRMEEVQEVVCEEKHMGSRAIVNVLRRPEVARTRFGLRADAPGIIYTRTGRRFFDDEALEAALLERLTRALETSGLWDELATDWLCLDCELLPWSAKARGLLEQQYAPVGAAARSAFAAADELLAAAAARGLAVGELRAGLAGRAELSTRYVEAYRRYCAAVDDLSALRIAPFHVLAGEGLSGAGRDHRWHMDVLGRLCTADRDLLQPTRFVAMRLDDAAAVAEATRWWFELTAAGGEGMVVKPLSFVARGPQGVVQPGVKCRGREYLRLIYGPEYTRADQLPRLRARGLRMKRSLALREFALGLEALDRFGRREPLRRVHECVFGVLALESLPVDPRL